MFDEENRKFLVVNAFAEYQFGGNPAAIFPTADGLSDAEMQLIARQLNLVETVFVFGTKEPEVDYHLRYFTPIKELPIAGHPTVAAWVALVHERKVDPTHRTTYYQRTQPGVQEIGVHMGNSRPLVSMEQRPPRFLGICDDRDRVAGIFGVDADEIVEGLPIQAIDTGLGHIIVPLENLDALMRVTRNVAQLKELCSEMGVREAQLYCMEARRSDAQLHTRNLCPREGLEDPACGVGNGALGVYLAKYVYRETKVIKIRAEQGHIVDMPSIIDIEVDSGCEPYRTIIRGSGVVMLSGAFELAL